MAEEILDRTAPGEWNQAVMELGATVCTPRRPVCPVCPVRAHCAARVEGIQDTLPQAKGRRAPVAVTVAGALVEEQGRVLLVRRTEGRLLGRFWEVPQTSLESRGLPDLVRELSERHGLQVEPGPLAVRARHAITYRRIRVEAYRSRLLRRPAADSERYVWATPDEIASTLPVSSMTRKMIRGLLDRQAPLPLD